MGLIGTAFALLWLSSAIFANPSCPESPEGMVTVHLVCHTHDDVGWLKTVDQYFYGARNSIQRAGVQYILDSVVDELKKDASRKFSYVESAFLYRWWNQQLPEMQDIFKELVSSGQLELVNGGWCMNDEAAAHYNGIIDQMTLGLAFMNNTFGTDSRPRVAWQIDPFGHAREQASLFAQMGFDGLFFGRLDYNDKDKRWKDNDLEMVWQASESLGEAAWLFTGVLPNGYNPPKGFCFDDLCNDEPIMDDPMLEDYNVDLKVIAFLATVKVQAKAYRSNNIIMTMGSDFMYQNAGTWYKNLDKLIKYVNARQSEGSNVHVVYSTPSCYLDALHSDNITWNTKQDDFFPYASDPHAFWTGYFTSRPALKGYIRKTNAYLQALKQVITLRGMSRDSSLESLAQAMGVAQHHDAITGTAKQHVTDDYVLRLSRASQLSAKGFTAGVRELSTGKVDDQEIFEADPILSSFCPMANISSCTFTETQSDFHVVIYNSIARPLSKYIRIPVPDATAYKVTDHQGNGVVSQLVPIPSSVLDIPYRNSTATQELVFLADQVPALGSATYVVSRTSSLKVMKKLKSTKREIIPGEDTVVHNGAMSLTLDGVTGLLKSVSIFTTEGVKEQQISQNMLWYAGMNGDNSIFRRRASGAYIFRPNGTDPETIGEPEIEVYEGELVNEIHQKYSPWASQVIRLYKGSFYVEVEWMVGPIPIDDDTGKEIIMRYSVADMVTDSTFYTDSNGRETIKRVIDHRDTWTLNVTEPVAGNYYPVTSRILVDSSNDMGSFVVLNDRAQGGSSLNDGEIELMVHRRLLDDDAFGVGEALNETAYNIGLIARGTHLLLHSDFATTDCDFTCQHRLLAEQKLMEPVVIFQEIVDGSPPVPAPSSGLNSNLPEQVHLLTLEPWYEEGQYLVRLENMFAAGESDTHSQTVTVDLENLLSLWTLSNIRETVLSANQWLEDSQRLQWNVNESEKAARIGEHSVRQGEDAVLQVEDAVRQGEDAVRQGEDAVRQGENADRQGENARPSKDAQRTLTDDYENRRFNPRFRPIDFPDEIVEDMLITLKPMQIRTFIVNLEPRA